MNRFDRPRRLFAVALAGLAGFVDSAGFLSANGYFVSFMSGNTTRLGIDLSGAGGNAALPALLLGGFVVGVTSGALIAEAAGRWRKPVLVASVALLLLAAAGLHDAGHDRLALAPMVMAMGALNMTFQRNGTAAIGLTYMTGALVRLGQAIAGALTGNRRSGWLGHTLLWAALAGGAVTGANASQRLGSGAFWAAGAIAALLALAAWAIARRENPDQSGKSA